MNKNKIFNDPVYGFVNIKHDIIYDLIQHPYFQRLRRISQLGMTHLTYPGAVHTRFHHALGALHLMNLTIALLRQKGVEISDEEDEAASVAILLHDLGHGPFSHALEELLVATSHENLSLRLMQELNETFEGRLTMAIEIFKGSYHKPYLHQLISGQLDMDRMDYLNRDSFYTGVMEGKIGYDRIINMLRVVDGRLVVEEKGLASIENFLVARKIMYWQVYLHKTVLAAELMMVAAIRRAKDLYEAGQGLELTDPLETLFSYSWLEKDQQDTILKSFVQLDDIDIMFLLKNYISCGGDYILKTLAKSLLDRNLFKVKFASDPISTNDESDLRSVIVDRYSVSEEVAALLVWSGKEDIEIYSSTENEIEILHKDGSVSFLSELADFQFFSKVLTKYFICFPR